MNRIIELIYKEVENPPAFGAFHLICIGIIILITCLLIHRFKDCDDKTFRKLIWISWAILIAFVIFKQLVFSYTPSTGKWEYKWYILPFQFCSSPIYVFPLIASLKDSKCRDALIGFASFFIFFAGVAVYIYPNGLWAPWMSINIQTMIHHGIQIAMGLFIAFHERKKLSYRLYVKSMHVFMAFCSMAMIINEICYRTLGPSCEVNMYFISPHFRCTLPVLSSIQASAPYIVFLLAYIVGFFIAGYAMYWIQNKITNHNK